MIEIKPPALLLKEKGSYSIFLAGSISTGKTDKPDGQAEEWQKKITDAIKSMPKAAISNVHIYNPRRDEWDPSWEMSIDDKEFADQVEWELEHLEAANLIVMYLQPGTLSPISLMELGLYAKDVYAIRKDMIVLCPEGFHRKGNVDVMCMYFDITIAKDMDDLIKKIKARINTQHKDKDKPKIDLKKFKDF